MAFNIEEFKNRAGQDGFLKNNKFRLNVNLPVALLNVYNGTDMNRNLSFMCDATSMPGVLYGLNENRRYGYGPVERKPYAPNYNDLMVDILVDGKANTWKLLYNWLQLVMNNSFSFSSRFGLNTFEVNYKENYRSTINLEIFNDTGEIATVFTFNEAFPTSITDRPLSWASTNELLRIQTNWSFYTWTSSNDLNVANMQYFFDRA